ncbi:RICIN domain-containing protein [Nannocystis sp. SCPEA4]|uniref:RICIN domain-containing protein n=1 Tax=Nannocystis sp. SCPEA4 TaxID=2996787 RepID=UPI00226FE27A|nr:RICIN domain-containing protein [Nannocystis sp. SCPEA4]MCY1061551.1 RICIN domain-containing protein [Nannocystis sp. SCPEA4]
MSAVEYFFIISKARGPGNAALALSASPSGNGEVVVTTHSYQDERQMWEKRLRQASNPGVFGLVNKSTGTCVARASADNGAALQLVPMGRIGNDDLAVWQNDNVEGQYNAVVSVQEWEQKINIFGDGPYVSGSRCVSWHWDGGSDNELWRFASANREITLKRIEFMLDQGSIVQMPPSVIHRARLVNSTAAEQELRFQYTTSKTTTETYSASAGLELSVSYKVEISPPVGFKSSLSVGSKVTTSITFGKTEESSETVSLDSPVKVPANSAVKATVIMQHSKIDVPFRAVYDMKYDDGTTQEVVKTGTYNQVAFYNVEAEFYPEKPGEPSLPADGVYKLVNKFGKSLDVNGGATAQGTSIIQWPYGNGANQKWELTYQGGGCYKLTVKHSNLCLDVSGAQATDGAPLIQWQWHGGNNQLWQLVANDDGTVRVQSKLTGKVIDTQNGESTDGAVLVQRAWNGSAGQRWTLTLA